MQIAILSQDFEDLTCLVGEEAVVRHHDGGAATGLQDRHHALDEVQLLVAGGNGEGITVGGLIGDLRPEGRDQSFLSNNWQLQAEGFGLSYLCKVASLLRIDEVFGHALSRTLCGFPDDGVAAKPTTKASWSMTPNPHVASRPPSMLAELAGWDCSTHLSADIMLPTPERPTTVRTQPESLLPEQ